MRPLFRLTTGTFHRLRVSTVLNRCICTLFWGLAAVHMFSQQVHVLRDGPWSRLLSTVGSMAVAFAIRR